MCCSTVVGMPFWANSSLIVPCLTLARGAVVAPDVEDERVLARPRRSSSSITRPTWTSACSANPAATSISRRWNGRCSSGMSSHAGICGSRGVSCASAGIQPFSFARAKTRSRYASQPSSNLPAYLSAHSLMTWCGRVQAAGRPVHEERLVGLERLMAAQPGDRVVGEVLAEVIALLRRLGGRTLVVLRTRFGSYCDASPARNP